MSEDSSLDQEAGSVREQRPRIHPHRNLAFPSFGGPGRGNKPFFLGGIQHSAHSRPACRSAPAQQKLFNMEQVDAGNQNPKRGGAGFWVLLLQECETFPKEIPPPSGRRGRKGARFLTHFGGSEREAAEGEGADWSAVREARRIN